MTARNGEGVYGDGEGVVTPLAHRLSQNGALVRDSTGKPRSGVFYAGDASLVSGKANMSYDVAAFEAAISRGRTKGTSFPTNDAVVNVTTTAAPGSNSRIDVIYVQQKEVEEGDATTEAVIGVVQGTAASSPAAPSIPDGAIELARAVVPSGITATTSATITQTAPFTAPLGTAVPFRTSAERDAAGAFASGTRARLLDSGREYIYSSGWKAITGGLVLLDSINFSAVSSVTSDSFLDGIDNYKLVLRVEFASAGLLSAVFRNTSGSDLTTSNYDWQVDQGSGTTAGAATGTSVNNFQSLSLGTRLRVAGELSVLGARSASATALIGEMIVHGSSTTIRGAYGGYYTPTTTVGGIKINASQNITGTLDVYGYIR